MENLQLNIERFIQKSRELECATVGVYLRLYLLACQKTGDDIENGRVEIMGMEAGEKTLADLLDLTSDQLQYHIERLVNSRLIATKPLTIVDLAEDNRAYLGRRRRGTDIGTERGTKAGTDIGSGGGTHEGTAPSSQERKGKERKGCTPEPEPVLDVTEFIVRTYQPVARRVPTMPEIMAAADCIKAHGREKAAVAIGTLAAGAYRLRPEHLAKIISGEWDKAGARGKDVRPKGRPNLSHTSCEKFKCQKCGGSRMVEYGPLDAPPRCLDDRCGGKMLIDS